MSLFEKRRLGDMIVVYRMRQARWIVVLLCLLCAGLAGTRADLVDINRATAAELKTLPGIRDAYAAAIAKNRPYINKAQLLSRKIIPAAVYKQIKDKIIAKQ